MRNAFFGSFRRNLSLVTLNSSQRIIVSGMKEGVSIVSAGPGSGKTRVLAHRIVHLLDELPHQSSIIALTFSNKAQQEMKSRVDELNPNNIRAVKIHTFHSFCSRILRTYGRDVLGDLVNNPSFASNFSTFDQAESLRLVKNILKRNQLNNLKEDDVFNQITKSKENTVLNWTNQAPNFSLSASRVDRLLYDSYERDLRESNAADFLDLLVLTWRLLREYPIIRAELQRDYQHILIDEYQDTNLLQYEITKLLYQPPAKESLLDQPDLLSVVTPRSLFVVGDVNQSIYSWRGALPENLNRLTKDFPNCFQYNLKVNYRSSPNILTAANAVLGNISTTPPMEKLDKDHLPVYVYSAKDDLTQAEFICRSLKSMNGKSRAILYRTNAQSHALEVALMQAGVKYRIRGGRRYIDRKEVQDLLSYLRLLSNPRNLSALKRSINTPSRGIGDKSQLALFKWIEKTNSDCLSKNHIPPTLLDYLYAINLLTEEDNQSNGEGEDDLESSLLDNGGDLDESLHASLAHSCPLTQREKRTLSKYSSVITKLHRMSLNTRLPLTDLVNTLLTTIDYRGYITQLSQNDSENEKERWENIVEILKTADRYSDKRNGNGNGGTSLENFIEYYDCFQTLSDGNGNDLGDKAEGESDDLVELMTIHASKGLEFDVVVISGAEEGVLPLTSDGNCEEEERRLAYVAITRAKSLLIITYREHLKRIRTNGSHYRMKTTPSRFLNPLKSIPATNCIWVKS